MTNIAVDQNKRARFVPAPDNRQILEPDAWAPLLVTKAEIDAEIERMSSMPLEPGTARASLIVHPQSTSPGFGLAPGMALSVNVLNPGEETIINRDNANRVEFCIRGDGGFARIGDRAFGVTQFDVWTVPSMMQRYYRNASNTPLVWFSYSNVPLLDKLGIHYSDESGIAPAAILAERTLIEKTYNRDNAPDIAIGADGARIRGYEYLVDIEAVKNGALHWAWQDVTPYLSHAPNDGKRTIMLLYNPATERRNGTTHSFFATLTSWPAGEKRPVPPSGHRHSSFACNYHFLGRGSSIVDGERFEWQAGDLMLSAPNWSEHAHGSSLEGASVLTIQDHPFQIGVEALIWQEKMDGPILTLGSEPGQAGYVGPRLAGD